MLKNPSCVITILVKVPNVLLLCFIRTRLLLAINRVLQSCSHFLISMSNHTDCLCRGFTSVSLDFLYIFVYFLLLSCLLLSLPFSCAWFVKKFNSSSLLFFDSQRQDWSIFLLLQDKRYDHTFHTLLIMMAKEETCLPNNKYIAVIVM